MSGGSINTWHISCLYSRFYFHITLQLLDYRYTCRSYVDAFIWVSKKTSSKWVDSSSELHLQGFSSILQRSSSKVVDQIGVKSQIIAEYLLEI